MTALKPPRIKPGDLIGIVAPASPPSGDEKIQGAVVYLEKLGYRVKLGPNIRAVRGYLAGDDTQRASDINAMFADPEVTAIFALRGGYGTPRLLPSIDYSVVRQHPKVFVGFSDITALQLALFARTGLITFSGPLPGVEFWNGIDPFTEENFWRLVTDPEAKGKFSNPEAESLTRWGKGVAQGRLLGGTLALVTANLGTPYSPLYRNAILVLEDVGEYPYRLDRMLIHLRNAGALKDVRGVILGQFTNCEARDRSQPHLTLDQVLADIFGACNKPILANLQYGHIPRKLTLPIGARVRLDADAREIELLESAVTP